MFELRPEGWTSVNWHQKGGKVVLTEATAGAKALRQGWVQSTGWAEKRHWLEQGEQGASWVSGRLGKWGVCLLGNDSCFLFRRSWAYHAGDVGEFTWGQLVGWSPMVLGTDISAAASELWIYLIITTKLSPWSCPAPFPPWCLQSTLQAPHHRLGGKVQIMSVCKQEPEVHKGCITGSKAPNLKGWYSGSRL